MENKVPIRYKGTLVGYTDGNGNMEIENKELWNNILLENSQTIFISSRAKGTLSPDGKVVEEQKVAFEIQSLTKEDKWQQDRDKREWNRYFPEGSVVMLEEEWMTEKEKETFKDLIGKYGTVLKSHWEMHGFGQGSIYSHVIQWPGGKKTGLHDGTYDNKDFTPVGLGPMSAILEDFHYKFAGDLEAAFPGRKIEFGRGERILIDSKIVPGILCSTPRMPYKMFIGDTIEMIKQVMKL